MYENLDILLTTAKVASRNNPWAHLATHTISMSYNLSMLWHYQYQLNLANAQGFGCLSQDQIQSMKQECVKHTILGILDGLGLLISAIDSISERRHYK